MPDWPNLIYLIVGALIPVLAQFFLDGMTERRDRRKALFQKQLDQVMAMENHVGHLVEVLGSYEGEERKNSVYLENVKEIDRLRGNFRRYPAINQAIREVLHFAGLIASKEADTRKERDEFRNGLNDNYVYFLGAVDREFGLRRSKPKWPPEWRKYWE